MFCVCTRTNKKVFWMSSAELGFISSVFPDMLSSVLSLLWGWTGLWASLLLAWFMEVIPSSLVFLSSVCKEGSVACDDKPFFSWPRWQQRWRWRWWYSALTAFCNFCLKYVATISLSKSHWGWNTNIKLLVRVHIACFRLSASSASCDPTQCSFTNN